MFSNVISKLISVIDCADCVVVFVVRCSEDRKNGGRLVTGSLSDFDNQTEYWTIERLTIFTPHQVLQRSSRMIWAGHVARMRKTRMNTGY